MSGIEVKIGARRYLMGTFLTMSDQYLNLTHCTLQEKNMQKILEALGR